ncbi:MAG TPA: ankyrin repeat domain-containing protein, partial [Niastella sp.]
MSTHPEPDHESINEPYPILAAMNKDDPNMVKLAIEAGADVNIEFDKGWTHLHYAISDCIDGLIQNERNTFS